MKVRLAQTRKGEQIEVRAVVSKLSRRGDSPAAGLAGVAAEEGAADEAQDRLHRDGLAQLAPGLDVPAITRNNDDRFELFGSW